MSSKKDSKTEPSQQWTPSDKQKDYVVSYLASQKNHAEACRMSGASRSTVSNWQKRQEFNDFLEKEVDAHREKIVSDHREKLREAYSVAVDGLITLAKNLDYKAIAHILEAVDPEMHDSSVRKIRWAQDNELTVDNKLEVVFTPKRVKGHDPEKIAKNLKRVA